MGERFVLLARIQNVSDTDQTFSIISCPIGENWRILSGNIFTFGQQSICLSNVLKKITLKPGEVMEKSLPVRVRPDAGQGIVRFWLRFMPHDKGPARFLDANKLSSNGLIDSNIIKVTIGRGLGDF